MATLAGAARTAGRTVPRMDQAAYLAAREICRALPSTGPPSSTVVEFSLRSQGIIDPPPHMVIANLPVGLEDEVLDQLGGRFRQILGHKEFSRVGIGVVIPTATPRLQRVLVALLENRVDLEPMPRRLAMGQQVSLRFRAASSHHGIQLVVTPPDGKTVTTPLAGEGLLSAPLACRRRGVYQVEVTGEGQFGPEVLANFPVYCDQDPPVRVTYAAVRPLGDDSEQLERELFEGTNRVRRKTRLPQLRREQRLTAVARKHSRDMRDNRFVGHVSPTTGRPIDRLRAAGVLHLVVRENVAQAYSTEEALRELLNSPAHRENILSRDVTEMGIGIVVDRRASTAVMLVTQLFMKPGKAYNPATAKQDVLAAIRRGRSKVGLGLLKVDATLDQLAGEYVLEVIAGGDRKAKADATLAAALRHLGNRFHRIDGLHVRVSVIDALEQAEEIKRKRYSSVGIGVGQVGEQVLIFLLLAGE